MMGDEESCLNNKAWFQQGCRVSQNSLKKGKLGTVVEYSHYRDPWQQGVCATPTADLQSKHQSQPHALPIGSKVVPFGDYLTGS